MATKIVKNVDHELWTKFACSCKIKKVKVGNQLNKILEEYLKNG